MIIFSNIRISVALSHFSRDRQLMLAQDRRDDTSGDAAAAAAAAAAATEGTCTSSQGRSLRYRTSLTLGRATSTDCTQVTAFGNGSFNQLQMKVGFVYTEILSWVNDSRNVRTRITQLLAVNGV